MAPACWGAVCASPAGPAASNRAASKQFAAARKTVNCARPSDVLAVSGRRDEYLVSTGSLQNRYKLGSYCAAEWIRTTTLLRAPAPQAGASASSATTARFDSTEARCERKAALQVRRCGTAGSLRLRRFSVGSG